jgi:FAD/FMN-containing dehydrogenase
VAYYGRVDSISKAWRCTTEGQERLCRTARCVNAGNAKPTQRGQRRRHAPRTRHRALSLCRANYDTVEEGSHATDCRCTYSESAGSESACGRGSARTMTQHNMTQHNTPDASGLASQLRGQVLTSRTPGFEPARAAWNGLHDRRPAIIARCTGAVDVQHAVDFARRNEMPIAVRSGGHSFSGASTIEGGLLIDLSPMGAVHVDASDRVATVQGGALWGLVDRETQAYGLATTAGVISHTGVGGLTLGGGIGRLMRRYGLTCDNVLSFDLVTADSDLLHITPERNTDLNWALRGGGGNFGIVTNFQYQLHPVGPLVLAGSLGWPVERAPEAIAGCQYLLDDSRLDLYLQIMYVTAPADGGGLFPADLRGRHVVLVNLFWGGDIAEGERYFKRCRAAVSPALDTIGPVRYEELQRGSDALAPHGRRAYIKSGYFPAITPEHILAAGDTMVSIPTQHSLMEFVMLGGKVSEVGEHDTAFAGRDAGFLFESIALWDGSEKDDEAMSWCQEVNERFAGLISKRTYANLSSDEAFEGRGAAGVATASRLAEIKRRYDPTGVFHHNPNVRQTVGV